MKVVLADYGAGNLRSLSSALVRGLASTGLDVVDIGPVTTPMLYYVAATRGAHGCSSLRRLRSASADCQTGMALCGPMNRDRFWALIESARTSAADGMCQDSRLHVCGRHSPAALYSWTTRTQP